MAVESRLTQAVLKEAKKFLHEEPSNQGKDMPVGMPFRVPPPRWYEEKIKEFTAPSRETLIRQGDMRTKNQGPFFGEMNMFFYDAKFKKTLPYWDRFPLVIPLYDWSFDYNPRKEFMGINFHYLSIPLRIALLNELVELYITNTEIEWGGETFNDKTRLVIKNFSKMILKTPQAIPCVKHYLNPYIRTNIRRIKASEFIIALLLPVEDFQSYKLGSGGDIPSQKVWRDSATAKAIYS